MLQRPVINMEEERSYPLFLMISWAHAPNDDVSPPVWIARLSVFFLLLVFMRVCVVYFFFMLTILDGQQLVPWILWMEFWVLLCSAILTALLVFIIMLTRYCLLFWSICGLVIEHESLELLTIKEKAYIIIFDQTEDMKLA